MTQLGGAASAVGAVGAVGAGPTWCGYALPALRGTAGARSSRWCGWWSRVGGQDGASTVEMLLLAPLIVLLTFLPVQVGLWMHARQLVTVAAQEAARAAARADLSVTQAEQQGREAGELFAVDQQVVDIDSITVQRRPDLAVATVEASGVTVVPGLHLHVSASASSAVEQFTGAQP